MKKIKVGVLMGGPSAEREISLVTGKAVVDNLDTKKYLPSVIEMDAQSFFWLPAGPGRRPAQLAGSKPAAVPASRSQPHSRRHAA